MKKIMVLLCTLFLTAPMFAKQNVGYPNFSDLQDYLVEEIKNIDENTSLTRITHLILTSYILWDERITDAANEEIARQMFYHDRTDKENFAAYRMMDFDDDYTRQDAFILLFGTRKLADIPADVKENTAEIQETENAKLNFPLEKKKLSMREVEDSAGIILLDFLRK